MLDIIISSSHSVFISGRLIFDNIMVSYKIPHFMKTRQKGSLRNMTIKLDMSKNYIQVKWSFLKAMMRRMCFYDKWRSLIMTYIFVVYFFVMMNGRLGLKFSPSIRLKTRRSLISIPIYTVCRRIECST